jgi:uncharacterized alkaline shock family protein YloU
MTDQDTKDHPGTSRQADPRPSTELEVSSDAQGGTTSIEDAVIAKIASIAAREVDGVASLGGTISSALAGVVGRIRGDEHRTAGVGVEVGRRQAAVDLSLSVRYPASIPDVTDAVRQNVIDRIETLSGLEVVEVNIVVVDLDFPEQRNGREARVE